jgi:putative thioredoxin
MSQNPAFSGAVDLSTLAQKVVQEKLEQSGVKTENSLKVPAFSIEAQEATIRQIIQISSSAPVVVVFYSTADATSISLTTKLDKLAKAGDGNWLLAKVNMDAQAALTEAFGVIEAATVAVILAGEPKPLFQGDQEEDSLSQLVQKITDVAKSQGLIGKLVLGEEVLEQPKLSESEQAALDAMDRGDFSAAVQIYETELQASPNNELLAERLAQVKLVERTYQADVELELALEPIDCKSAIRKSDFYMAIGDSVSAFNLLLDWFSKSAGEDRGAISAQLLELFVIAGKSNPSVISARKQLAAMMF